MRGRSGTGSGTGSGAVPLVLRGPQMDTSASGSVSEEAAAAGSSGKKCNELIELRKQ